MQPPEMKITLKPPHAQVMLHDRTKLDPRGSTALDIARSLALAAFPDGESKSGEPLYRRLEPDEVVKRAVEITALIYATIEERGWLLTVPSLSELEQFDGPGAAGFR